MKHYIMIFLLTSLAITGLESTANAQIATEEEALTVANNWIELIIQKRGDWGSSDFASIDEIHELKYDDQTIGYFCRVRPQGFIVLSLHKAFPPVKAYSTQNDMAPDSEKGMADLVKGNMKHVIDACEKQFGPVEQVQAVEIEKALKTDFSQMWENMQNNLASFIDQKQAPTAPTMNYQEGDILLFTSWYQLPPYNYQCPDMGCMWMQDGYESTNAKVGCVATAGAQIMRYWSWPPYGEGSFDGVSFSDSYNWTKMANRYVYAPIHPSHFIDENGNPVTQSQLNAVAELCHEIGVADQMNYGCDVSIGSTPGMKDVYADYFRYVRGNVSRRSRYSQANWFNMIKQEINANRPVHYRMVTPGGNEHSVVADGWQEVGNIQQLHINYGHDDSDSHWYTTDRLDSMDRNDNDGNSRLDDQVIVTWVRPVTYLGRKLASIMYPKDTKFPYRYFDQDATGSATVFASGQYLQFLQNISVAADPQPGNYIYFIGEDETTRLFTRGDPSKGIRIDKGRIKLINGGSIRFR